MKIVMRVVRGVVGGVVGRVLVPDLPVGADALLAYHEDTMVVADVRGARNPRQHNLFWVLMEFIADNHPEIHHKDAAAKECKIALELYDWHIDRFGGATREFRSIAWESMEQGEFDPFFKRAVDWACAELGSEPEDVMEALYHLIGDKRYNDVLDRVYRHVVGRKRR